MAQRDIEAIAEEMRLAEEAQKACDEAYEKAQAEEKAFEAEEFEELEDEIIDPASMGFVDSEDVEASESDAFYNEEDDDGTNTLEEDVSDCLEQEDPIDEAEGQGSIEVEVYNEDGFGKHFAAEVMKNVPGVTALTKKAPAANGDIIVKISGSRPDLEKAFAFYVGQHDYASLPREDKEEFESLLVFDDGDTLAEADYREAIAHCLDPIGVNASTADLVAQDTCAINIIKEERCKRKAKKMLKALHESEFEELSDEDLAQLEGISDAIQSGEGVDGMTDDERITWNTMLGILGYTPDEWDKLSPEQQERAFQANADLSKQLSKSGFAHWQTKKDPKTGKLIRYQNQYQAFIPKKDDESGESGGERIITAFNPDYTSDDSMFQHPKAYRRNQQKNVEKLNQERRDELAKQAMLKSRGKDTWNLSDFAGMLTNLSNDERKSLMDELIAEIQSEVDDKQQAANEIMVIKKMFGQDVTLRDLGSSFGDRGAPAVKKFVDDIEMAFRIATRKASGSQSASRSEFNKLIANDAMRKRFIKVFANELNARKAGKNPIDPQRLAKHQDWLKMLKDLGYTPAKWDKLSTDEQLKLMDQYDATHAQG